MFHPPVRSSFLRALHRFFTLRVGVMITRLPFSQIINRSSKARHCFLSAVMGVVPELLTSWTLTHGREMPSRFRQLPSSPYSLFPMLRVMMRWKGWTLLHGPVMLSRLSSPSSFPPSSSSRFPSTLCSRNFSSSLGRNSSCW